MSSGGQAMSTPIQQLPPTTAGGAELPTDPEVMAVLNEMEAEVNAARSAAAAAGAASAAAAMRAAPQQQAGGGPPSHYGGPMGAPQQMLPPGCYFGPSGGLVCGMSDGFGDGGLWNAGHAQNAAIAAAIALALFYPASLEAFYQKIPVARIAALFSSNDKLVRAALFAAIVYVLLLRMNA